MIRKLPLVLTLGFAASTALADTQTATYDNAASKEETAGFFSGAVLGALAGGPPGAIVGAAIGAFTGDGVKARKEVGDIRADLYAAHLETQRMREETRDLQQRYELAQRELDQFRNNTAGTILAYLSDGNGAPRFDSTELTVHFRTGSAAIEPQYQTQLHGLARLAGRLQTASVEITGYADRNGDAESNLRLSRQRTAMIQSFFNDLGIQDSSITTVAYGESRPLHEEQSLETDFFDRRVIVRLRDNSEQMLSQNPDGE